MNNIKTRALLTRSEEESTRRLETLRWNRLLHPNSLHQYLHPLFHLFNALKGPP
ncbi:hypothetical protein M407DRAFT_174013 [Tulasnella calospora MUT 4182]|uniref:Uncharacterized protein n=1 Tax=Tulasnella calospora MUT 4182 TaxID=1051891 RepID=A0A0C3Q3Q8_9AGAM|nr:hypothetical protein M407DRAFT_174013 [Tulasnella calospora MUT 4182]